jgi:hypothetical protein
MEVVDKLSNAELVFLESNLDKLSDAQLRAMLEHVGGTVEARKKENCQDNFMDFVHKVWPHFIDGDHHVKMAAAFERVAKGECKRLIVNMPPLHTKSEFASYLLPAWFLGKFTEKKIFARNLSIKKILWLLNILINLKQVLTF